MSKKVAVIAIGGNSLIKDKAHQSVQDQYLAADETAKHIVEMINEGWDVVVGHGNGPQVGFLLQKAEIAEKAVNMPMAPLEVCGAQSQGQIGYQLVQCLQNRMKEAGINKPAACVIEQTIVNKNDPAFQNPTKPIGGFMTEEEAKSKAAELGWVVVEDAGRGWRRVVPSPEPKRIVELDAIRASVEDGSVVICCGGGGIPVKKVGNFHKGVGAVIDKDNVSSLLADNLNADILLILTAIDKVRIRYGKPDELSLDSMSLTDARRYIADGEFAAGSMLPKVEAAARFVENGNGRIAVIAALHQAGEAVKGQAGTVIFSE